MSISFIIGSAGAGKSYELYNTLTDEAVREENSKKEYIVLVPEQYSMESQKEILLSHKRHGSFNIEVVSFSRLAYAVFDELNIRNINVMDDLGKTLVMRKVLEQCKNNLIVYKNKISMPGFVEKAKTMVTELKQYNYSDKDIDKMIEAAKGRSVLKSKLTDVSTINKAFNKYIEEKMITNEDVLNLFCKYAHKSDLIKNSDIYIDSFTGFTPIQYKVLEQLIRYSQNVTIALTLPEEEADFTGYDREELFSLSKETIVKVKELAIRNSVEIGKTVIAGLGEKPYRIRNAEELCHIEKNIFRNKKILKYEKECKELEVHRAAKPSDEAAYISNEIAKLMLSGKYRYKDIAVIAGDMEGYHKYIEEEFEKNNIPCFIDYKRSICSNPYVDGILAIIEIIEKDFSYESVFRFLKLGVMDITRDDIDLFENYVLAFGRRGYKSYVSSWERKHKQMDNEDLEKINIVREKFIEKFKTFREQIKEANSTIADKTKALYEFIVSLEWQKNIHKHVKVCRDNNNLAEAKEYEQVYGEIVELFERMVKLLGDEVVSLREYKQLIKAGFECVKVGIIPPGLDTVMVGDLERTRLKDIKKVIFFAGVNDTVVPASGGTTGIITDVERDFLRENTFELAPTARDNIFKERLYLYSLFAKPSEKLYLSYVLNGTDGSSMRKSYIISNIEKMFPLLKEQDESRRMEQAQNITGVHEALEYVTGNLRKDSSLKDSDEAKQVIASLVTDEENKKYVDMMVEGAYFMPKQPKISETTAKELYGNGHNIGVTRLENYVGCAYSQFLSGGLKLNERRKYEVAAVDIGNLYHNSLDMFCRKLKNSNMEWVNISEEDSRKIALECVETVMQEYENDALSSSARNKYIARRVQNNMINTVEILKKHLQNGKFRPEQYEMVVEHGRIDRVDVYEREDKVYVKVIDYKSGNKKFSIADTYMGLQMQLLIYLKDGINALGDKYKGKKVVPGGAFYYVIKDPYIPKPDYKEIKKIKRDSDDAESAKRAIREYIDSIRFKEFKMSGIFGDNEDLLEALDNTGNSKSEIIPLSRTKSGFRKDTMALGEVRFEELLDYVKDNAEKVKKQMLNGNIDIKPIDGKCTYCKFRGACRFDERNGDRCRERLKLSLEDVMKLIEQDNAAGGNDD